MGEFIVALLECIFEAFVWAWEPKTKRGFFIPLGIMLVLVLGLILVLKLKG